MDNINTDFFSFNTETDIDTEIDFLSNKDKDKPEKLQIKVISENIPQIFTKVRELYNYIKLNSDKRNDYYYFYITKNNIKISIIMKSTKQILNYILTYHVYYDLI